MKALTLSVRALRRDWRSGELRIIALALVIAVAAVSAVGSFTNRVERAMTQQAAQLLGADLLIRSSAPIPEPLREEATRRGLQQAQLVRFPSVVLSGEQTALVSVKAVSAGYPLRGQLRTAVGVDVPDQATDTLPARGELWVGPRLLALLGLGIGDQIQLGVSRFTIARVITFEPDRSGDLFQLAPRALMNQDDLAATALLNPASRVQYRFLFAGDEAAIGAYRQWLAPRLAAADEIQGVHEARPQLRIALDRAGRFLGLAALMAVLLGGAAIAVAAGHFAARQADASAIMRCLGASQNLILTLFLLRLIWMGLAACVLGAALGYAAQAALAFLLSDWFNFALPAPSLGPAFSAVLTGLVALIGFALPPVLRLRQVSPLRVLRKDLGYAPPSAWTVSAVAFAVMALLMYLRVGDPQLALWVIGGSTVALLALALAALGLLWLLKRLRLGGSPMLRFGLAGIVRRGRQSVVQLSAIGLGIMALLILVVVRVDLLSAWERSLPADAPNHFLINIQAQERAALGDVFRQAGLASPVFYPMVRARLAAINDRAVSADVYTNEAAKRRVTHAFNLSWSASPVSPNPLVQGQWWNAQEGAPQGFSVEQSLAQMLGIQLGDQLRFEVAGESVQARVDSIRRVEWDSFEPNFFVIASAGVLEDYPSTYMTSVHLPFGAQALLVELIRQFPSVTVLDVRALMDQVRVIMARATTAVEFVFGFTLLAGLMVLYAAIQASQDERRLEAALIRSLGGTRRQILAGIATEFTLLGLLAGLLASSAASVLGYVLATQVFELPYGLNPWLWLAGLGGGALGVGLAGVLGVRPVLAQPPWQVLRYG